jgi:hypothetical protein
LTAVATATVAAGDIFTLAKMDLIVLRREAAAVTVAKSTIENQEKMFTNKQAKLKGKN